LSAINNKEKLNKKNVFIYYFFKKYILSFVSVSFEITKENSLLLGESHGEENTFFSLS